MTEAAAHIRRLFLDPKDTYSADEAAGILGIEPRDLKNLMESGELEGVRTCCGMKLSRKELISFAMDYWPQEAIEEALGDDLAKGIPKLLRLTDLHVRIPASRSSPWNASQNATASPSTPSSPGSCAISSPPNRISLRRRSPTSRLHCVSRNRATDGGV
jgi:hypothetical protein